MKNQESNNTAPSPLFWAWSFYDDGDSGEWIGRYKTIDQALTDAMCAFNPDDLPLGQTASKDVYFIQFCIVNDERVIVARHHDEVSVTNENYPPNHVKGCA